MHLEYFFMCLLVYKRQDHNSYNTVSRVMLKIIDKQENTEKQNKTCNSIKKMIHTNWQTFTETVKPVRINLHNDTHTHMREQQFTTLCNPIPDSTD